MFEADTRDIIRFERDLKLFKARALPFATKSTLNSAAFDAQRESRAKLRSEMTLRNKFTKQSVQVEQARTLNIDRQESTVGATVDYLERQEFGGTRTKRGSEGTPIPTSFSAGQGMRRQPRTRLPVDANRLANIQLKRRKRRGSRKQQNLIAIKEAASSGRKHVFLELQRTKGIFLVQSGKKRPRIRMVYDLTRSSVRIPRNPWLKPSVDITQRRMPAMYAKALRFQLQRLKIFD